jgi:pimeloyl-ACP methyl ester carboxylesterase
MTKFESIIGRYVRIKIKEVEYRVYFEQNGSGIPLLCQHTADADGRQWRHVLNDEDITNKYQVIAADLPYHGKSLPPESIEWWKEEYRLTKKFFIDFQTELIKALDLKKPVFMGCSMGGSLAVDLALERPNDFRAIIGMESGMSMSRMAPELKWWDHPRISNRYKAAAMFGHTAPCTPEKNRREIAWVYSQGAPSVMKGDLHYHFLEHDLTGGQARRIDTTRIPLFFMTGDYDWGNSPEDTKRLVDQIKGAKFLEMKGLGHFPMSEDFQIFKSYLMPILNQIADT